MKVHRAVVSEEYQGTLIGFWLRVDSRQVGSDGRMCGSGSFQVRESVSHLMCHTDVTNK